MQQGFYLLNQGAGGGGGGTPAVVGQTLLYSGNGGTQSITGASFSPDWVLTRRRSALVGSQWRLMDSVRGASLQLVTSNNGAEATDANGITSFDANGFSLGNAANTNGSGVNFLAVLLQEVANAFDIVAYTGTGSAHAENHGLGVVPELIIVKNRTTASRDWAVYSAATGNTKSLFLNGSGAATVRNDWNNTDPTSTQFSVSTSSLTNASSNDYIAYLFASLNPGVKVGTFTGDGNTNGPVVTTGFRPKFVIIKRTDASGDWIIFDDQMDPTTPHNTYNRVNVGGNVAEEVCTNTAGGLDFQSTGFQSIDSDGTNCQINVNGGVYLYLAIA